MTEFLKIAHLDEDGKTLIQQLEQLLDRHVMAFDSGLDIASLTAEQLAEVKTIEERLGVTLLVYEK